MTPGARVPLPSGARTIVPFLRSLEKPAEMEKKIKVLIVDDEYLIAKETGALFQMMGLDVCKLAGSGKDAIEIAKRDKPDIVVMDIRLGGPIDGIQAAREIKAFAGIPIIFISGNLSDEIKKKYEDIHPAGHFEKPISARKIARKIREVVGGV